MIHSETLDGIPVATGDIICTANGAEGSLWGQAWRMVGLLVPGQIDHVALFVGPHGACVEAGARGVIQFAMHNQRWQADQLAGERLLYDHLVGVAYPLQGLDLSPAEEARIRQRAARFCLEQIGKPYNINFFAPARDAAFYCSQLVYKAYFVQGIEILQQHAEVAHEDIPLIVTPQMLWDSCAHQAVEERG
jgi:hypothetical protein